LLIDQHLRELENSKRDYDNIILAPPLFGSTVKEVETEWMHYKDGAKIATDKFK
jgi:23S rRNA G2069 N7-methylase RlmK/C1962 C5-methylase RlmI